MEICVFTLYNCYALKMMKNDRQAEILGIFSCNFTFYHIRLCLSMEQMLIITCS